jgi:hypothetical protein
MSHEEAIRALVGVAHEVKIELQDARIIFATPVAGHRGDVCAFVIRPWGWKSPMTIRFVDVLRVTPVRGMIWERQRAISAAQMSGVFTAHRLAV